MTVEARFTHHLSKNAKEAHHPEDHQITAEERRRSEPSRCGSGEGVPCEPR
jgi:hypothetical protein